MNLFYLFIFILPSLIFFIFEHAFKNNKLHKTYVKFKEYYLEKKHLNFSCKYSFIHFVINKI